ncbi:hypothetical protein ABE485_05355 [Achromobacter spanius]|uniref:hypothetical protein n=1 Tax=Achromobacter spanius TaxID=217203 RepID=UPI003208A4BA
MPVLQQAAFHPGAAYLSGGLCATATATAPQGSRYFPPPSHVTSSPVGRVHTYFGTEPASWLRFAIKRLSTRHVERSGSFTITSDSLDPEAMLIS